MSAYPIYKDSNPLTNLQVRQPIHVEAQLAEVLKVKDTDVAIAEPGRVGYVLNGELALGLAAGAVPMFIARDRGYAAGGTSTSSGPFPGFNNVSAVGVKCLIGTCNYVLENAIYLEADLAELQVPGTPITVVSDTSADRGKITPGILGTDNIIGFVGPKGVAAGTDGRSYVEIYTRWTPAM